MGLKEGRIKRFSSAIKFPPPEKTSSVKFRPRIGDYVLGINTSGDPVAGFVVEYLPDKRYAGIAFSRDAKKSEDLLRLDGNVSIASKP